MTVVMNEIMYKKKNNNTIQIHEHTKV